ncbi:hypothetical protein QUA00_18665 [Microcoleus sp. T2B6]
MGHRAWGMGHGASGMGHRAWGIGHGASGMGHGASGMGHRHWTRPHTSQRLRTAIEGMRKNIEVKNAYTANFLARHLARHYV